MLTKCNPKTHIPLTALSLEIGGEIPAAIIVPFHFCHF